MICECPHKPLHKNNHHDRISYLFARLDLQYNSAMNTMNRKTLQKNNISISIKFYIIFFYLFQMASIAMTVW